jgi:predicted dehydrogenase
MTPKATPPAGGPLKTALIGAGWIAATQHLPNLRADAEMALALVVEPDAGRAAEIAGKFGVRVETDAAAIWRDPSIAAVVIAAPTGVNAAIAVEAFGHGRHVYVEKPMATSVAQGQTVAAAWRAAGTIGAVGYCFRHAPVAVAAAELLAGGALGEVRSIHGVFQWASEAVTGWRQDLASGGGAMFDMMSHHIDLAGRLAPAGVTSVAALTASRASAEDAAWVTLARDDGSVCQLHASVGGGTNINRIELHGTAGSLRIDFLESRLAAVERKAGRLARVKRVVSRLGPLHPANLMRSPAHEPAFGAALHAFAASVRGGRPLVATPDDAVEVLKVLEAARRSAGQGGRPEPLAGAAQ